MELFMPRKETNFDKEEIKQLYVIDDKYFDLLRVKDKNFLYWVINNTLKLKGHNELIGSSLNLVIVNNKEVSIDVLLRICNLETESKGFYLKRLWFQNEM